MASSTKHRPIWEHIESIKSWVHVWPCLCVEWSRRNLTRIAREARREVAIEDTIWVEEVKCISDGEACFRKTTTNSLNASRNLVIPFVLLCALCCSSQSNGCRFELACLPHGALGGLTLRRRCEERIRGKENARRCKANNDAGVGFGPEDDEGISWRRER